MFTDPNNFELTPPASEMVALGDVGLFFACFMDFLYSDLIKSGVEQKESSQIVTNTACHLSELFSGEVFYVSKQPTVWKRWMGIYNDLRTMNHRDVDRKYGVSVGYSLTVAKQIDDMRKRRDQLRLFGD